MQGNATDKIVLNKQSTLQRRSAITFGEIDGEESS